jgi:oxygen-independent coproporphyrinogen-3 oxidase
VPWLKSHQQLIKVEDLPQNDEKLGIFLNARQRFLESGYDAIGMDHFAKSTDELANAYRNGTLHRNFMGYTVKPAIEFIGIGVSSIGYIQGNFVQNEKEIKRYYEALDQNQLPVDRGLVLSSDDLTRQWVITTLMCQFRLNKQVFFEKFQVQFDVYFSESLPHMTESVALGLLKVSDYELEVTELGRLFVRNIAMGFDAYLKSTSSRRFSKTV